MLFLLRLLAYLPLPVLHAVGAMLGWTMYGASARYRRHLRDNLAQAGYGDDQRVRHAAITSAGCMLTELPALWLRPHPSVIKLIRAVEGWDHVTQAQAAGQSIVFLTPHLGCFEISAQYGTFHFPMAILYRAPRLRWLETAMRAGRARQGVHLATADRTGVRELLAALKRREAIGILPDQVPGEGEGVWADFFGRPAYTMTLAPRLAAREGTVCLIAFARRLSWGRGYVLSIRPYAPPQNDASPAQQLNQALEDLIRTCPGQYLWGYNRYKVPARASEPQATVGQQHSQ